MSAFEELCEKEKNGTITDLEKAILYHPVSYRILYNQDKAAEQLATLETNCTNAIQANIEVAQLNAALQEKLDGYQSLIDHHKEHHAEYEKIKADIEMIEANYDALQTPMVCGHLARYAIVGDEGTGHCVTCLRDSAVKELAVLQRFTARIMEDGNE